MTRRWSIVVLVVGACSTDPGVVKNDCPGTPKIVSLAQPGPFWSGLERVNFTVPDGTPSEIQLQTFNPALGTWTGFPSPVEQRDDGSYVASASITPNELTKDASFKLRVRALLESCPPSDWAVSAPFTVGDPVADTSWKTHVDVTQITSFFQINIASGTLTATGPYSLSATGVDHTMQFHASGAVDETWAFGLTSGHAGDVYAGCKFSIHYVGQWRWQFTPFFQLVVNGLVPAPAPLTGSTCTSPPIADLALNQPGFVSNLQPRTLFPSINYTRLLYTPPGSVLWEESEQINMLSQILFGLSDVVGADQATVPQGQVFFNTVAYEKQ
jgi:hypothetical protein